MSSESRLDETGTSVPPRKLMAEGRDFFVVGSKRKQDTRRSGDDRGQGGKMNYSKKDLDRCLWRRSTHHLRIPSKADSIFCYSRNSRQFKPATAAKLFRDADRSSAPISLPRRQEKPPGLAGQSELVTSIAYEVMRENDDVGLTSSLTPNLHCGKVFECKAQRNTEELSGRTGMAGRKEEGLEPRERQELDIIDWEEGEIVDKGKRREEQRQLLFIEAENFENNTEKNNINNVQVYNKEQSQQGNEIDAKREERQEEGEKEAEKEEDWGSEVSSSLTDPVDAVNDLTPEDKISGTLIREVSANRNINQPEPSRTVTIELLVPQLHKPDAGGQQKPLSETVPHDWLRNSEETETRCHVKQLQHVAMTTGSQTRCVDKILEESFQAQNGNERIAEVIRETATQTELKIAKAAATCRLQSPLNSFEPRRRFPQSSVRSTEPQLSSSNSRPSYNYNMPKYTNDWIPGRDVRVREVTIGNTKIRLISKSKHPQPNRASILRQVAAASSSMSSVASSGSRSAAQSPAMFYRNSAIVRNFPTALVFIQGPFAKEHRKSYASNKSKPTCLAGNPSSRRNSPDSIKTPLKTSRTKYQTTRTFLVDSKTSPGVSPTRRSFSSTKSPPKRNRPTPAESAGKRTQKERPKGQQRQPRKTFFVHSRQIKSGDDAQQHHYQPQLLQQRKSVTVHRTATRTLVARVQEPAFNCKSPVSKLAC